jgi:hypothetical protein
MQQPEMHWALRNNIVYVLRHFKFQISKSKFQRNVKVQNQRYFWHLRFGFDLTFEPWHLTF